MKKLLFVVIIALGSIVAVNAQPRAIGGRIGNALEASYQHSIGDRNMISIDAGYRFPLGVGAAATYDWIFPTSWGNKGEWNWYAGPGVAAGFNSALALGTYDATWTSYGYVGVAGRVGLEYQFWFPLQLSVDYRPSFGAGFGNYFTNGAGLYIDYSSFAVSARYLF